MGNYADHVIHPPAAAAAVPVPVPVVKKETIMGGFVPADTAAATDDSSGSGPNTNGNNNNSNVAEDQQHHKYTSYASGASTPDLHSDEETDSHHSHNSSSAPEKSKFRNPKSMNHSSSAIGLDEMIEDRRADGDLRQNVVHIEVPFGKPIEEVYEGVHSGPVLGSGISGLVRLVTHKATGLKYAVKVLDLGLVDTSEGLVQLREEIFIMCQVRNLHLSLASLCIANHSSTFH